MTREDIIYMVQETIFAHPNDNPFDFQIKTIEQLQYFAALVAAAARAEEREACARVCDELSDKHTWEGSYADECAQAIRARGRA